jgi:hypothetical protein
VNDDEPAVRSLLGRSAFGVRRSAQRAPIRRS